MKSFEGNFHIDAGKPRLYCCIFIPTQVLTCSGSKGMISACKGAPQRFQYKDKKKTIKITIYLKKI